MIRIVLVDDNQLSLKRSESLLLPLGYEVISFTGAEAALQLLATHPVSLVLVDLAMPIHTGYDLMNAMKAKKINAKIVVVSGKNKDEDVQKALAMGAQDYILKPFDDDFFIAKVNLALQKVAPNGALAGFSEAIFDGVTSITLNIPQIHVSEIGFYFDAPYRFIKGAPLDIKTKALEELNIPAAHLRIASCTDISKGGEPVFRTFISFMGLNQAQLTDVRLWIRQQQIKYRKS